MGVGRRGAGEPGPRRGSLRREPQRLRALRRRRAGGRDADTRQRNSPYPPGSLEFWRSDDAGASWTRIGGVPHNAASDLAVAPGGEIAHPVLYLVTDSDASGGTYTKLAAPILSRSRDGGQTWAPVAVTGLPSGASIEPSLPATLDDGSALVYVSVSGGSALYAWAPATSAWRLIAPPFTAATVSALILAPQGAGQPQAIYVVSDRGVQRYPTP